MPFSSFAQPLGQTWAYQPIISVPRARPAVTVRQLNRVIQLGAIPDIDVVEVPFKYKFPRGTLEELLRHGFG